MASARYPVLFAAVVTLLCYPLWYSSLASGPALIGTALAYGTFWFLLAYGVVWMIGKFRGESKER